MADIAHEDSTEADGWVAEIQVVPSEKSHSPLVAVRSKYTLRSMPIKSLFWKRCKGHRRSYVQDAVLKGIGAQGAPGPTCLTSSTEQTHCRNMLL